MGQGERIESFTHCPLTPRLKRSLETQIIKKSLNLNLNWYLPRIIFVAMSLIIILLSGLAYYYFPGRDPSWMLWEYDSLVLLMISFAQIITLGAVWKMLSGIIKFYNLKPNSIYVAMILLFILLSGRAYYYMAIIFVYYGNFLVIMLLEIVMLAIGSTYLSEVREFSKTKTSSVETGSAIGVDWQWVLIGLSLLLFHLVIKWFEMTLGGPGNL